MSCFDSISSSDTLVGFVFDKNPHTKKIENRIFFFYDRISGKYQLRGASGIPEGFKYKVSKGRTRRHFSFSCESAGSLIKFVELICNVKFNMFGYEILSFPGLPLDSNLITFRTLELQTQTTDWVAAYDDAYNYWYILQLVDLVKEVFNPYETEYVCPIDPEAHASGDNGEGDNDETEEHDPYDIDDSYDY